MYLQVVLAEMLPNVGEMRLHASLDIFGGMKTS